MTFIGHASVKIVTTSGKVIYIDPFYPTVSYREPADYILVTHSHSDHNVVRLCTKKPDCVEIHSWDALKDGDKYFQQREVFNGKGKRILQIGETVFLK
ncbi:MAG: MBL fold metallo-hydrolase [Clostridiales bacterium]|nr:MBL fold metallo-hydrolase [Clostridiales bacterium]